MMPDHLLGRTPEEVQLWLRFPRWPGCCQAVTSASCAWKILKDAGRRPARRGQRRPRPGTLLAAVRGLSDRRAHLEAFYLLESARRPRSGRLAPARTSLRETFFSCSYPTLIYKAVMAWKFIRFVYWRVWLIAVATLIPLTAVARPATADTAVTCTYTVSNSWNGGFTANVDIANNGPAINGWTLRWTFTTPTAHVQGWSAIITEQDGNRATATNLSWNGTILTGQTASFGWSATAVSTGVPRSISMTARHALPQSQSLDASFASTETGL
jgi:cellulase/cellobiase CelA1